MRIILLYISLFLVVHCNAQDFEVKKAEFNSSYDEYAAGFIKDAVIFSSNKKPKVMVTYMDADDNYYSNLYVSQEQDGVANKKSEPFAKELATDLNDGSISLSPDGKTMWYTSNIKKENQKIRHGFEFKLGIFKAEKKEGVWQRTGQFHYNSYEQDFNTAHPAISPDGNLMVFASDREGSVGASDLWMSRLSEGGWQKPTLLPPTVNTNQTELFPFIDDKNVLYFSSNGHNDSTDLDIYRIKIEELETGFVTPLPAPINSEFDDFGLIQKPGMEEGYFSSDREEGIDNVFTFKFNYPQFVECQENYDPSLCYIIEESNMTEIDTLPFKYIWDLGDGTSHEGFVAEHCYSEPGVYNISLNVIDSITGVVFAEVNDMELVIELPNQPYISSADTLVLGQDYTFSTKESVMTWHDVEEWYWDMGDGSLLKGEEVNYQFDQQGVYYITVGALSVPDSSGEQHKVCTYKEVLVLQDQEQLDELLAQQAAEDLAQLEAAELAEQEGIAQAEEARAEQARLEEEALIQQTADQIAQKEANALAEKEAEDLAILESLELESLAAKAETKLDSVSTTLTPEEEYNALVESMLNEPEETNAEIALEQPADDHQELAEQTNTKPEIRNGSTVLNYDNLTDHTVNADSLRQIITDEIIESAYFVELLKNEESIPLDDEFFKGIQHEITERFQEEDSVFIYSVGQAEDIFALWDIYQEVLDSGYISAIVKQERLKNFKENTEVIGFSNPKEEQEEWNRTITNFANIQFDSNSSRITELSMASLDYIAIMMLIEEEFRVDIQAYSDNKGNADYNLTLSKRRADAVKRYLIRKGITADRLSAEGYGELNPISDNETEQGRAINRRVEFKILSSMF